MKKKIEATLFFLRGIINCIVIKQHLLSPEEDPSPLLRIAKNLCKYLLYLGIFLYVC